MRVRSGSQITIQVALLLSWSCISSANVLTDIPESNPLGIYYDPAPSPEDGPPLSAGATRDRSKLPAEIGGIVGAYAFSVAIIGLLLILISRNLRRKIQQEDQYLDIEMLEPGTLLTQLSTSHFDSSPQSAGSNRGPRNFSWPSPDKKEQKPYVFPNTGAPLSPPGNGDPQVDDRIVEADREMLQRDLEDLYAHVMEQEEAKAAGVDLKELPPPAPLQSNSPLQSAAPVPATSPQRRSSPTKKSEKQRPSQLSFGEPKSPKPSSRASSIISSIKSPKRKGIRGMRISSPMYTPHSAGYPASPASDEEPLSSRYCSPPPPPPVPKDQAPYTHSRNQSSVTMSDTRSTRDNYYHRTNPSQVSMQSSRLDPQSATSANLSPNSPLTQHPHLKIQPPPRQATASPSKQTPTGSTRNLPFRQFEPEVTSPSYTPYTKTTVLERTVPQNTRGGPNTGGLKTPWTAGAVPYSPYQPFTPMLPVTPTLVTREERKMRKKVEGKKPVLEMIKAEEDLWG